MYIFIAQNVRTMVRTLTARVVAGWFISASFTHVFIRDYLDILEFSDCVYMCRFLMFYFGAVCFFSYVSFKAVVLFEPTCPINTVLLFTILLYCICVDK